MDRRLDKRGTPRLFSFLFPASYQQCHRHRSFSPSLTASFRLPAPMESTLRNLVDWSLRRAAKSYVIGPHLSDAIEAASALEKRSIASTIAYWDSPSTPRADVARAYEEAVDAVAKKGGDHSVSIKAPSINYDVATLGKLVGRSRSAVNIHLDALAWESAEKNLAMLTHHAAQAASLGCTLPGRWRRSITDAHTALKLGVSVRIVKGQWPGPQGEEQDATQGFQALVDELVMSRRMVSVATHNATLAKHSLTTFKKHGTPCELQLLYGLPSKALIAIAEELEVPLRVYLPYGHAWLPYMVKQVLHRPAVLVWLFRDLFLPHPRVVGDLQ